MSDTINKAQEKILRRTIAAAQETISECNKLLIDGGCEPEPESLFTGTKVVFEGTVEKASRFFSNVGKGFKTAFNETKEAGKDRIVQKEIDKEVSEQMKKVEEELRKAIGVSK
jgi:hypothetical protein